MGRKHFPHVSIYTDGACRPNPGEGGWAAILIFGPHEKVLTGGSSETTSNRMELQAAVAALETLKQQCYVDIHVDSRYLQKGITEWLPRWQTRHWYTSEGNAVKNVDLWQRLDQLVRNHKVNWHWIQGHSGHPHNDRVHQLAQEALDRGWAIDS